MSKACNEGWRDAIKGTTNRSPLPMSLALNRATAETIKKQKARITLPAISMTKGEVK